MTIINFTKAGIPISDFNAQQVVYGLLDQIEKGVKEIKLCNVLVWTMLRAELLKSPLKQKVIWAYESKRIDMDDNMRTSEFWRHPVTSLLDTSLEKFI